MMADIGYYIDYSAGPLRDECPNCGEELLSSGHVCKSWNPPIGWQCPKCGRGNSPYSAVCPCGPDVEYTTANTTGKLPPHFWPSGNE